MYGLLRMRSIKSGPTVLMLGGDCDTALSSSRDVVRLLLDSAAAMAITEATLEATTTTRSEDLDVDSGMAEVLIVLNRWNG